MTAADFLELVVRLNLAAAAATGLVLLARRPARGAFGPQIAYGLWLALPLAMAAVLLPARRTVVEALPASTAAPGLIIGEPVLDASAAPLELLLLGLWLGGAALSVLILVLRQRRFLAHAEGAGPAIVGALIPRLVLPADFAERFDAEERALVLAHEREHIRRQDARINGLLALLRCLFWFNPLIHIAGHAVRVDQELACDAAVIARFPSRRRLYAEAMLKTQLISVPLPLGCHWPAAALEPLKERIAMLKHARPGPVRRFTGAAAVAALACATGAAAWAAQPPVVLEKAEVDVLIPRPPAPPAPPIAPAVRIQRPATPIPPAPPAHPDDVLFAAAAPMADGPVRRPLDPSLALAQPPAPPVPPPPPAPPTPPNPRIWDQRPSVEDAAAAARLAKQSGTVRLRCKVAADRTLQDCKVMNETPQGADLGAAALTLAGKFRVADSVSNKPGSEIFIPIRLMKDAAPRPDAQLAPIPPAPGADPRAGFSVAIRQPGETPGSAEVVCERAGDGRSPSACRLLSEAPAGKGIGSVALAAAARQRFPARQGYAAGFFNPDRMNVFVTVTP